MEVRPNIGAAGRRFRHRLGLLFLTVAAGVGVAFVRVDWTPWRLIVFFPIAAGTASLLEVRRRTCVLRAAQGTIEDDRGHTTPAAACDLQPNRQAAARILRDAALAGALGAAVLAAL